MSRFVLRPFVLFLSFFVALSFSSKAQSFEISSDVCDSLAPTSYLMHVSGYATFTDSIVMTVELMTADSLHTIVYNASKDFDSLGVSTLTNFTYDPSNEDFSLDIGNYSSRDYQIRIISRVGGEIREELIIDTF
jgi:hypothetical protein